MADRLEQRRHADRRELRRDDRLPPRQRHEGRRREVVDLRRPVLLERLDEPELVEEVGLDEVDAVADPGEVLVLAGRAARDADHLVARVEQELREQ
jgi:hypothetical protein